MRRSIGCRAPICRRSRAASPGSPASSRWTNCCARAGRNSPAPPATRKCGRRTARRARRNPKAGRTSSSVRLRAAGRPADGDRRAGRGRQAQRARPGAARRHRLGQDLHHGQGHRGDAAPGADPRAEQDARRPALRRVQVVLPRQRGRVFRLLLRLLPAGSLRPAHRHLHREGILDQRADRPHAPLGDALAARARRRHHRRLGVLHLRHRLGRDLYGDDLRAEAAASAIDQRQLLADLVALQYKRNDADFRRGTFRVRGDTVDLFPAHFEDRAWRIALLRRRDRVDRRVRSAHRPEDRRARRRQGLRQLALRHAAPDARAGDRPASRTSCTPASPSSTPPAACSKRSGSSSAPSSTSR